LEGNQYVARCSVEWILNNNALVTTWDIRLAGLKLATKTFAGWDPTTQQIKQWGLDASGGHGGSVVTKDGKACA
jgi:hypothetical protein